MVGLAPREAQSPMFDSAGTGEMGASALASRPKCITNKRRVLRAYSIQLSGGSRDGKTAFAGAGNPVH